VSPLGTRYQILASTENDPLDFEKEARESEERFTERNPRWDGSDGETFSGWSRRAAKTSISSAGVESFNTLIPLLNSLPSDEDMRDGDPEVEEGDQSQRVAQEQRNVRVRTYLHAASKEADNDYHLIVGGRGSANSRRYMNVEVSGLPPSGPHRQRLKQARIQFLDFFGDEAPGMDYDFYNPPIPVRITGSLFYDMDHRPGGVGPASLRRGLKTSWEIHPITKIEFLDE
jgi:hypothetical protein